MSKMEKCLDERVAAPLSRIRWNVNVLFRSKRNFFSSLFLFRGLREDGRRAQKVAKLTVFSSFALATSKLRFIFLFLGKLLKCRQVKLSFLNLTLPPERHFGLCNKPGDKKSHINDDEWRASFNKPDKLFSNIFLRLTSASPPYGARIWNINSLLPKTF